MQFKPLNEYIKDVTKFVNKRATFLRNDDDAISYIAYWGMKADAQFDPEKNDSRDGYRARYYNYGLKKYIRFLKSKKRKVLSSALSITDTKNDNDDYQIIQDLQAPTHENPDDYIELINGYKFLDERQKNITIMFWVYGLTLEDIGNKYKISKTRVSQILEQIKIKIGENIKDE